MSEIIDELRGIAYLIESLPQAICDEMEKREVLKNAKAQKQLQADIEFQMANMRDLNKIMFNVEADDPKDKKCAEQFTGLLNYTLQNPIQENTEEEYDEKIINNFTK